MSQTQALTKSQIRCLERLTQRQIHRLERLPADHEVVSIDHGPLIVRGPKGKLSRLKSGRAPRGSRREGPRPTCTSTDSGYLAVGVGEEMRTRPSPMTSISVWGAQTAIAADSRRSVRRSEKNAAAPSTAGTHSAIAR